MKYAMQKERKDWEINRNITIPEGVELAEYKFQRHTVETITLPEDVDFLPDYFCSGCHNLRAIFGGRNIKMIGYGAFDGCEQLCHLDFMPQAIGSQSWDKSLESIRELLPSDLGRDYARSGFGYVLRREKEAYLIWNVTNRKYAYAILDIDIPIYSCIEFSYKDSIVYDVDKNQSYIERNQVSDIHLVNDEDTKNLIYADDIKAYIDDCFPYIEKINSMEVVIRDYVDSLNAEEIIDSYTISIDEVFLTKVGGDDTYELTISSHCKAERSDAYWKKLLPSYYEHDRQTGYCRFYGMSDNEKKVYYEKERSIKHDARDRYSKAEHVTTLINAYIKYLHKRTSLYQEVLDAVNFARRNMPCVLSDVETWFDISEFTFKLNKNLHIKEKDKKHNVKLWAGCLCWI